MSIYTLKDLGTLNGDRPVARAINNAGVVVGRFANHAMRYEKGILQKLPSPLIQIGQANADRFEALGINNGPPEVIVGRRYTTDGSDGPYAVMWKDGVYFDLHASLEASTSEAWDVNDAGVIVGRAGACAFRFDPGTPNQLKFVQLLTEDPGPGYKQPAGCAKSINAHGHVAGWLERLVPSQSSPPDPTYEPFCFLYDGTLHELPLMTSADESIDVNDDVIVVGQSRQHGAFRYDHTAKTIGFFNLPVPDPDPNWVTTSAVAINKYGTVVGATHGGAEGTAHVAVVWPPGKPMQTLMGWVFSPPDGLRLTDAVAINDENEIVVSGHYDGELPRSFVIAPYEQRPPLQIPFVDQVVQVILLASGGAGLLVPGGQLIHPKGPPIDPGGPFRRLDPAQRDVLVGLAVQVLAKGLSDPEARRIAEAGGLHAVRTAVERLLTTIGQGADR